MEQLNYMEKLCLATEVEFALVKKEFYLLEIIL